MKYLLLLACLSACPAFGRHVTRLRTPVTENTYESAQRSYVTPGILLIGAAAGLAVIGVLGMSVPRRKLIP